ncbi:TonB-dependent receptor [Aquabacterium sp.]|uniref:TonB-dependent receptor n=1 Tax=Aquabacterium sp. TaxID=1872578 RepID=UPI003782D660
MPHTPATGRRTRFARVHPLRRTALAVGLLFGSAGSALAQQAATPEAAKSDAQAPLRVEVTGIRKSLDTSLSLKRDARGLVDGIVAEDIGKFPDTNLAESMQRISGVSIDRSFGEGSRITVRGIGPDFNLVLLNGRQMPVASIEATAASNSRSFDFANLASESISALEVYKTSRSSTPVGGMGATVNIKTARPFDNPGLHASIGLKGVHDQSNSRLPDNLKGDSWTPELSGIYSNTFADGTFGIALTGSHQVRHLGYNEAGVPGGWRPFHGDEVNWGTIPLPGTAGSENITNRPQATDLYSVPQNLLYAMNGIRRERNNGQLTLQYAPRKDLTATLDYTYSENKLETRRNELSAWFNFGPSVTSWTNGPVAAPLVYSETINPPTSDVAMAGAQFASKNKNESLGFNLGWKASKALSFELDTHHSTATSGSASPWGSNASLGAAQFNRGTTTADFSDAFPVLSIQGAPLDASQMLVTGSSFRNSYMKQEIDQTQARGKWKLENGSSLDFGVGHTDTKTRTAYGFVQQDSWGGATKASDYPDSLWQPGTLSQYFSQMPGSGSAALYNQVFFWDFNAVRDIAAKVGNPAIYQAPDAFSVDRRTREKSDSAFLQYNTDWEWGLPMGLAAGLRYERTRVSSSALVPVATGVEWVGNNEYSVKFGAPAFTTLEGSYSHVLPSLDFDVDLRRDLKLRASIGESIGRPSWADIQGGQTLDQLARFGGGTGAQGNPGLKPLKSRNIDLSLEYYYAKSSYVALSYFEKRISNYVGVTTVDGTPFNLHTPANGAWFKEAVAQGNCPDTDMTCIRNYIFAKYDGVGGVSKSAGIIPGQSGDPVMNFRITTPSNQDSSRLRGLELNLQHVFGNTGFGVQANYTKVSSGLKYDNASVGAQFALVGLSDTANLVAFYETDKYQVRLAYNWRGEFLSALRDGAGANPVYVEPYKQLDLSASYKVDDHLSLHFEAINLNDAIQRSHGRDWHELVGISQTGRRFMLGARYKF